MLLDAMDFLINKGGCAPTQNHMWYILTFENLGLQWVRDKAATLFLLRFEVCITAALGFRSQVNSPSKV